MNAKNTIRLIVLIALIAFFLVGCSNNDGEIGKVSLRVVDSSTDIAKKLISQINDYNSVYISIIRVELVEEDTVIVLEDYTSDPMTINLLDLGSAGNLLIDGVNIPLGIYNQIRMILNAHEEQMQAPVNPASFLILEGDATEYPIFVPSGAQTGLKVNLMPQIELVDGSSFEIIFDFNSVNTIIKTGQNDRYIFRPTLMSATVTNNS